jgi:nitrate reductase molybdenum cofactor assembly chaperone
MTANYDALARLFEYPDESYVQRCRDAGLNGFADEMAKLTVSGIQEIFISTFDWNPATSLDLGWHLYGDQYERGEFLVRMRVELRRHGIAESVELPDHLTHTLALLGRMEPAAAEKFAGEFTAPAVSKLLSALEPMNTPFAAAVRAVRDALPAKTEIPASRLELPVLTSED